MDRAPIRIPPARPEGCTCTWSPVSARDVPDVDVAATVTAADQSCRAAPHAPLWVSGRALGACG